MTNDLPFIERDVSWLYFNERVLQEAKDPAVPLYERIKFLAIYSSNLDEYFRVRVASIRSFRKLAKSTRREMSLKPKKLLRKIRRIVHQQQNEFGRIFRENILPELASNGIHLVRDFEFSDIQKAFAYDYFKANLQPDLEVRLLDKKDPPFLENRSLYLIVTFLGSEQLGMVNIPYDDRFVILPRIDEDHYIAFMDDLVRVGLPGLFPGLQVSNAYAVKMSRDAEIYIDDEYEGDLLEKIKEGLKERDEGLPTRFLYDSSMPESVYNQIKQILKLTKNDMIPGARYHNFNDFFSFPDPTGQPHLHNEPMPPLDHPLLSRQDSILGAMAHQDFLLHFPYQKYDYISKLIGEAAADTQVDHIKITLYRVSSKSDVLESMLTALKNGKKVTAFIEAKARFDEESNLYWGNKLSEAGATVRYSFPGIKVHTKLLLIQREEEDGLRNYAYLATGNFNEKTALIYSDFGLMTADAGLADEVARVFKMLEGEVILPKTKNILVAPHTLREKFVKMVDKEISNAKDGKEAWMIVKVNSLEDEEMLHKLIEASQAGVKIRMIVRGICRLLPGVEGYTENIQIVSIVDRFLEHARVYIFCNGGDEKIYLASADWMKRNLSKRVEVAFPVLDERIARIIKDIIDIQLRDNVKARQIDASNSNQYVKGRVGEQPVRAQVAVYEYFKRKLEDSYADSGEETVQRS